MALRFIPNPVAGTPKSDKTARNEIIILLTPHIIDDAEAADVMAKQSLEDAKRVCLGLREGFSFFARERIVVGYMQEANEAWQRYEKTYNPKDLDKAFWNVSLALNAEPHNMKAIRLKDKVLTEKNGKPHGPPNWTIWDNIHDRLVEQDKAKQAKPAATEGTPDTGSKGKAAAPAAEEAKRAN